MGPVFGNANDIKWQKAETITECHHGRGEGMTVSIVINCDTRPGFNEKESTMGKMLNGVRSVDFLTEGVRNKELFFRGHDFETNVYVDVHEDVPSDTLSQLTNVDSLTLFKHSENFLGSRWPKWNNLNFLNALIQARGKYIAHFDADMAAFRTDDNDIIAKYKDWIDSGKYDYICWPSLHSPGPAVDPNYRILTICMKNTAIRKESAHGLSMSWE